MRKISFDTSVGAVVLDGTIIAPLPLAHFRKALESAVFPADEFRPNNDFTTFGLEGTLDGEIFGINVTYNGNTLEAVWLAWDGGVTKKKGYETSKSELINDKNKLTKILSKILEREPSEKTEAYSNFAYDWGDISVSAALASAMVAVGINWRNP